MASSFAARFLRRLTGGGAMPPVEILPPANPGSDARAEPAWDLNASVEERADAFVSLFLNTTPKDLRRTRMGQFREQ
jgi:DNA-binding transcriptional regulator PaaX